MTFHEGDRWDDVILAVRCAEVPSDEDAWRQLWGRYQGLVGWRVIQTLPRALRDDAEDVVQEAFMRFRQVAVQYDPGKASLAGYLAVIAGSAARDWERMRRREVAGRVPLSPHGSEASTPGFDIDPRALLEEGRRLLASVANQRKRDVFEALLELKTPEVIAHELTVPISTVYRLQERYREWLAEVAASLLPGPKHAIKKSSGSDEKTGQR